LSYYLQALHPALAAHTGLAQQLWLARQAPAVRRFAGLLFLSWLSLGGLSFVVLLSVRLVMSSFAPISLAEMGLEAVFAILGSLIVAMSLGAVAGPAIGTTGGAIGGLLLGLALGLAFGLFNGGTVGATLGLVGGIVLGGVGSIFDRLRRPATPLSSWSYWGRAVIGLIFTAMGVAVFGTLLFFAVTFVSLFTVNAATRMAVGAVFGLLAGLLLLAAMSLGLRFEIGRFDRPRLRWHALDVLLLGLIGGIAGGFILGVPSGVGGAIALIMLWGVLVGVGGGVAMNAGNGMSATLTAAGLTWLLVAGPDTLFSSAALLAVATTLLAGLFSYVRLPVALVEVPLARWQYLRVLRRPEELFLQLHRSPIYWDDLIFYPLPALDQFLLKALRLDQAAGLREVAFVASSFQQGWAATRAQLSFATETLAGCSSPVMIAAAPEALDWLADEVMASLGQGVAEVMPRLLAIAAGVRTTLAADNPYSRRLGYREALESLDTLQRRLPSLGEAVSGRWQPVVDRWQQVLLDELDNVSATTPSLTTENPYQPGNPLQLNRKALFKGRQALREAVVNALLERHRPTLVLHGPRRMGKTSFLLQLPALLPGNTVPVFLDLQRPTTTQNTAAFFYSISRAISRDARPYRLRIEAPPRDHFEASPFEAFAVWLEDVALPAVQDFNFLLTFDEFEKLGEAVATGRLDDRVFDELRYLIQHQSQLALLFAGVQTLDELGPAWSSYFINVKPLPISYLRPVEAETLIRRPDSGADFNLTYPDALVEQMIEQTGGHPYLLQLLCSAVVEESNACHTLAVTPALLEAALERALEQGEPYFRNVWDEMAGPEGQSLLRQIALAEPSLAVVPASPLLERLVRRRVVAPRGSGYQIELPLVRRWLVERAPAIDSL
jgi:hypothetical protein